MASSAVRFVGICGSHAPCLQCMACQQVRICFFHFPAFKRPGQGCPSLWCLVHVVMLVLQTHRAYGACCWDAEQLCTHKQLCTPHRGETLTSVDVVFHQCIGAWSYLSLIVPFTHWQSLSRPVCVQWLQTSRRRWSRVWVCRLCL